MKEIEREIERYIHNYIAEHGYDEVDHQLSWTLSRSGPGYLVLDVFYKNAGGFRRDLSIEIKD